MFYYSKTDEEVAHDLAFDEHGADRAGVILEKLKRNEFAFL